jgi:ABC-2 type transport system ATP-binding protein
MRIEAIGLTKEFGGRRAVDGLSFCVEPGNVTGFLCPNGAGKSTTLQLMLGLAGGGGRTLFDGLPYRELPCPVREVGAVLDAKAFHPRRSARDHLWMLAAALLAGPRALLLDEPANGLDPHGVAWLRELLRAFAAGGGAVLVSSHLLAEMQLLADHVVVIGRGRLLADEPLDRLIGRTARERVLVRSPDAGRLAELLGAGGAVLERTGTAS